MKRPLTIFAGLLLVLGLVIPTAYAAYVLMNYETTIEGVVDLKENEKACCYLNSTSNVYTSFSKAFEDAEAMDGNQVVVAIPPTTDAVVPNDPNVNDSSKRVTYASIAALAESLSVDYVDYRIDADCYISSNTTFIIPYDTSSVSNILSASSSNRATRINSYIDGMLDSPIAGTASICRVTIGTSTSNRDFAVNVGTAYPELFRRTVVTVSENVTITNKGKIVIGGVLNGAKGSSPAYSGQTSHSYAELCMEAGAKIIQDDASATTHVFGYITESTKANGSQFDLRNGSLYLPFVLRDFRGTQGSYAIYNYGMGSSNYMLSPFNQFEFRNIHSQLKVSSTSYVLGIANIYEYINALATANIDTLVPLIGSGTVQIDNNTKSYFITLASNAYLLAKYNDSTTNTQQYCTLDFYGGFTMTSLSISLSISRFGMQLDTLDCYLPVSFRFRIGMYALPDTGGSATYDLGSQKVKLMPGSTLTVGEGVTLNATDLIGYIGFADRANPTFFRTTSRTGQVYPTGLHAADIRVSGTLNATTLTGNVVLSGDGTVSTTNQEHVSYEFLSWVTNDDSLSSNTNVYLLETMTVIRTRLNLVNYGTTNQNDEETDLGKVAPVHLAVQRYYSTIEASNAINSIVPKVTLVVGEEATASLDAILGYVGPSHIRKAATGNGSYSTDDDGFQVTHYLAGGTKYRIDLDNNVWNVFNNGTSVASNSYVKGSTKTATLNSPQSYYPIPATTTVSPSSYDVAGLEVGLLNGDYAYDESTGQYTLYVGKTLQFYATITNADTAYLKRPTWTFSSGYTTYISRTLASDALTCILTGRKAGQVTIKVSAEEFVETLVINVVDLQSSTNPDGYVALTSVSISEPGDVGDLTDANASGTTSSTLTINPSNAWVSRITWTVSGGGNVYYYIEETGTKTAYGVTSITIHVEGSPGPNADDINVDCTVIDAMGVSKAATRQTFTAKTGSVSSGGTGGVCLLPETLITMADGSMKQVRDIRAGDQVKVFNHETGEFATSSVIFNDSEPLGEYQIIRLHFSDRSEVALSYEHGFYDLTLNKYVYINETTLDKFIGHDFYKDGVGAVELVDVTVGTETTELYSPVTAWHLNLFANDFLSMPGGIEGLFNIFEYDENMAYDEAKKAADIEQYGLFTYEDFADLISYEAYCMFPAPYFKVAIGKGMITWDEILALIDRYSRYFP